MGELMQWMEGEQGEGRQIERYGPLPGRSRYSFIDRRDEARHVVTVRRLERRTQEAVAQEISAAHKAIAHHRRLGQEYESALFEADRAAHLADAVAGDNLKLRAEADILQSELFQRLRADLDRSGR
ncbi:MAG TPA: hypothetical protein VHI52_10700 [Verrucomicrobiae bacterium]|nr:hypothetical protein [Verrucomicrobiae bacterium]